MIHGLVALWRQMAFEAALRVRLLRDRRKQSWRIPWSVLSAVLHLAAVNHHGDPHTVSEGWGSTAKRLLRY